MKWLVRSSLVKALTDNAIHETVKKFEEKVPSGTSWLLESAGGKIGDESHYLGSSSDDGGPGIPSCFSDPETRNCPIQVMALHQYPSSSPDTTEIFQRNLEIAQDWIYNTFEKESMGPFPCFLASGESKEKIVRVYGKENWEKLKILKRKYDPTGLLRFTHFEDKLLEDD